MNKILLNNIKVISIKLLFIFIFIYILFFQIFGLYKLKNTSMDPSIKGGSMLLIYRLNKNYNVGDVILYKHDNKEYIARIIALEKDVISLNIDGDFITQNNNKIETYHSNVIPDNDIKYPYRVSSKKVFVAFDNRKYTSDSREYGAIDIKDIKGKVITTLTTRDI